MRPPFRPTGKTLPDGQVEVVDPAAEGGALSRPFGVSPESMRAMRDPAYAVMNPGADPRQPYPSDELGFRMGQGVGKYWDQAQRQNWSSNLVGAGAGAAGATALTYLLDAAGYKLFDKRPMRGRTRLLAALIGAGLGAGANHWMRANMKTANYGSYRTSGIDNWGADAQQLLAIRQRLASQVTGSALPTDLKSQILRLLDRMGGQDLIALARIVSPLAGSMAGVAVAKFFFGNSFLPSVAGGLLGFAAGHSSLSPRRNAMGMPML